MRVLVVEDEADLASTLSRALDEAHFAVDVAADGDEAQFMLGEVGVRRRRARPDGAEAQRMDAAAGSAASRVRARPC